MKQRSQPAPAHGRHILIVGSGTRFLSGISYYTHRLATALAVDSTVSVLLMRKLLPARFYPGRSRVGSRLTDLHYPPQIAVHDGLDWSWVRSLIPAVRFVRRQSPTVLVLQWWTGTVLHSYLLLALLARLRRCPVVLEIHEAQDVGELAVPLVGRYVKSLFPTLLRMSAAVVVHSEFDRELIQSRYGTELGFVTAVPHGPYQSTPEATAAVEQSGGDASTEAGVTRLLYFGVIRPFKGVEDLLRGFADLTPEVAATYRLTIVGETWEGWTLPAELIATHPHRERISFVNRYVTDDELARFIAGADGMVLPYHRSSASGPLHFAIGAGLPVMVTAVGGLVEAARDYPGVVFVPPQQPDAIRAALPEMAQRRAVRYESTGSWDTTRSRYADLLDHLSVTKGRST